MADEPANAPELESKPASRGVAALTEEQRMLVDIRNVLYDGSWEDFTRDLRARMNDEPHVFDIVPATARAKETIRQHLRMIAELERQGRASNATPQTGATTKQSGRPSDGS